MPKLKFEEPFFKPEVLKEYSANSPWWEDISNGRPLPLADNEFWDCITKALRCSLEQNLPNANE